MKPFVLLTAAVLMGGCASNEQERAATDSASGAVAPATMGTAADTGVGSMGAVSGSSTDSAAPATGGAMVDSAAMSTPASDSGTAGGRTGSTRGNQSQSGVVDTKTGASTLGPSATKLRPDQGQPTTSKGDTVRRGGDSVSSTSRPPR